jgi:hypothetical protein
MQIIEGFGSQLGLPDSVSHYAKTLVVNIDNLSTIGGPAERAIETVALVALAVSHRKLYDKDECGDGTGSRLTTILATRTASSSPTTILSTRADN